MFLETGKSKSICSASREDFLLCHTWWRTSNGETEKLCQTQLAFVIKLPLDDPLIYELLPKSPLLSNTINTCL
jgi:hypothetical protein